MARRFSAPIRIYNDFGHPRELNEEALLVFVRAQWKLADSDRARDFWSTFFFGLLYDPAPDPLPKLMPYLRRRVVSFRLADAIRTARNAALEVRHVEDAFVVDDHFIAFTDPTEKMGEINHEIRDVIAERIREGAPPDKIRTTFMDWPPCQHALKHALMLEDDKGRGLRGPKRSPRRRAATWGTYIIAWLVGSDTLAATLWNRLCLPTTYKWATGSRTPRESALKKYSEAKARLVSDLTEWCSRRIVNQEARHKTNPPLDAEAVRDLEELVSFYAQLEASGVDLSAYHTRVAYAGLSLFPHLWA